MHRRQIQLFAATVSSVEPQAKFLVGVRRSGADRQTRRCVEILLASADTSSVTLYYTLVMLAARPDLARILQAEIQDEAGHALRPARSPQSVLLHAGVLRATWELPCKDGGRLEKMDALLKESMRLKPAHF